MNEFPDNTLTLDMATSSSMLRLEEFLMHHILLQGPSYIMIATATGLDLREVERTIKHNTALKRAYNMAVAKVALAIREHSGNRTRIAESLKVQRHFVEQWIRENPKLGIEMRNAEELFVDVAESAILEAAQRGHDWAVLHILETKGASRGWAKTRKIDLHAYAQATNTDVRLVVNDTVAAIAAGEIDIDIDTVEAE